MLPNINLGACEMEVWLSVDGGRTFPMWISPWLNAKAQSFDWTVPNMLTNAAVMGIRFGCEQFYPETYAPQPASTFMIAKAPFASHSAFQFHGSRSEGRHSESTGVALRRTPARSAS